MYEDSEHRELYFEHRMSIEVSLYRDHEGAGSTPRIIESLFFSFQMLGFLGTPNQAWCAWHP